MHVRDLRAIGADEPKQRRELAVPTDERVGPLIEELRDRRMRSRPHERTRR
jgi:hypothetical protein